MFGPLTSVFSALAVIGVGLTLWFERKSFLEQRLENQHQRALIRQQAFESTFFNLARNLRDLKPHTLLSAAVGDRPFSEIVKELAGEFLRSFVYRVPAEEREQKVMRELYGPVYSEYADQLGPYFRSLYHWFKFIDTSPLTEREKRSYASVARAQIGNNELVLLAINALSPLGLGMRPYIERYGLLKHLTNPDPGLDVRTALEQHCFPPSAFAPSTIA